MAREVKGQVGCSLKACVAAILSIVTSIIVVIVVVNLLNTGAENENENVAVGTFDPPTRKKRSTEEDLFDDYWAKLYTVPNSTKIVDEDMEETKNWDYDNDSLFKLMIGVVSLFMVLAIIVVFCILCAQRSALARLRKQRATSTTGSWLKDNNFDYNQLSRGPSIPTSQLDGTPAMMRARRMRVRNALLEKEPVPLCPTEVEEQGEGVSVSRPAGAAGGTYNTTSFIQKGERLGQADDHQVPDASGDLSGNHQDDDADLEERDAVGDLVHVTVENEQRARGRLARGRLRRSSTFAGNLGHGRVDSLATDFHDFCEQHQTEIRAGDEGSGTASFLKGLGDERYGPKVEFAENREITRFQYQD